MTHHACDLRHCCPVGSWREGLELSRGAWAEDTIALPHGWLRKDRAPRNPKGKGGCRGRDPIKEMEKHVVSVEKRCFGIRRSGRAAPGPRLGLCLLNGAMTEPTSWTGFYKVKHNSGESLASMNASYYVNYFNKENKND